MTLAVIEVQTSGGSWLRVCDCGSHPSTIKSVMEALLKSNPGYQKLRVIDPKTRQILDMTFRGAS